MDGSAPALTGFASTAFRGSVQDARFTAQGDLRLTINVPYSDRHKALPMVDTFGLALDFEVHRVRKKGSS